MKLFSYASLAGLGALNAVMADDSTLDLAINGVNENPNGQVEEAQAKGTLDSNSDAKIMTDILAGSCKGDTGCMEKVEQIISLENGPNPKSTDATANALRRLKQLKVLILWLQPEHRFARYCFYGCWCLPDADHKLNSAGYGKPVDDIDASCKRQSQCYDCAQMDNDNVICDASTTNYNYKLHYDTKDPTNHWKKSIECTDTRKGNGKGGCKRSVCECDKRLAEELREFFEQWNVKNHAIQGGFDWQGTCEKVQCSGPQCGHELACCGNLGYGVRMPYRVDGRRACCGEATYDSTFYECCEGNVVQATGNC